MTRFAHRIRAAIVDLDGTMLDTVPDFYVAINRMRADFGLHQPVTHEQIAQLVGKGSEHLIRSVLAMDYDDAGVEQRIAQAMDAYQRHYIAINGDHSTLYPNVKEGLRALKEEGLKLAVVTNKPMNFAAPLLDKKGLRGYFDFVFGGDSFPKKKPDPLPLIEACKALGCDAEQVVALGDSSNDAHAARAAGCYVLTVPYGYNHGVPVHEIESDGIVDTLLEAATLIRQHNRDVL